MHTTTDRLTIPFGLGDDELASWPLDSATPRPHLLAVGRLASGKTVLLRTIDDALAQRGIPRVVVGAESFTGDRIDELPATTSSLDETSALFDALNAELTARYDALHRTKTTADTFEPVCVLVDDIEHAIPSGAQGDRIRDQLTELITLGAAAGIRVALTTQHPPTTSLLDFGTRITLGALDDDAGLVMWGDTEIGISATPSGQGLVTDTYGYPMPLRVWTSRSTTSVDPNMQAVHSDNLRPFLDRRTAA